MSQKQANGQEIMPRIMHKIMEMKQSCISDIGCNVLACPLQLTEWLGIRIELVVNMQVTIADKTIYQSLGMKLAPPFVECRL